MAKDRKALALVCTVALILSITGCGNNSMSSSKSVAAPATVKDDDWQEVKDGIITLDNANIHFELNSKTTHFNITDKKSGKKYSSVPALEDANVQGDELNRMQSEITVRYYEEQTTAQYMYSTLDSVENENFILKTDNSSVRVYYKMGKAETLVPEVFDKKSFDNLLERLNNNSLKRRFERYYVLYSADDKPEDYNEKLKKYSILKNENLYIMDDFLSDVEKDDISGYLEDINYTSEEYKKMLEKLKLNDLDNEHSAGFTVPVEYKLNKDGFTATVLSNKIKENSDKYKLQSIDFLEYFASYNNNYNGNFIIPDGSGAMIHFNAKNGNYSAPYYGEDYSVQVDGAQPIQKQLSLPIYGISESQGGILAIIEEASECADLNVLPYSSDSPLNHAYLTFNYRSIDVTDYGTEMKIPIYNLFSKHRLSASPSVRYVLLDSNKCSYNKMAAYYRNYLQQNNTISKKVADTPVYLDYLCMITKRASMLGISYTQKIVLSTISEITDSVEKVISAGVGPCVVRLFGYSESGLEHKAYTTFNIDRKVGTISELKKLSSLLSKNGGRLYLDSDIQFTYKNGNGFSSSVDAARYLNRLVVYRGETDIVTNEYSIDHLAKFFISPSNYDAYSNSYLSSLKKAWKNSCDIPGLSYGLSGKYLGGDYAKTVDMNRYESCSLLKRVFANKVDNKMNMIFDNGNEYVLKYASGLLNVPDRSSALDSEYTAIPFYQMVIHGFIPYAATAINVSVNASDSFLQTVSFGAAPYMAFITRDDSLISNTDYESMWYSLSNSSRLDDFTNQLKKEYKVRKEISGSEITYYEKKNDTLTKTVYSNGKSVYVNFGQNDVVLDGRTIPSRSYVIGGC